MPNSAIGDLLPILHEHFNPREEGWMWLAAYDDDRPGGVLNQVEGAYKGVKETADALAFIIDGVPTERAFLALCRQGARPTESDRELWRILRSKADSEKLVDLVIFDRRSQWSMRAEDAAPAMSYEGTTIG